MKELERGGGLEEGGGGGALGGKRRLRNIGRASSCDAIGKETDTRGLGCSFDICLQAQQTLVS